ncbi:MAG: PAS domain S-box protein [Chthoniobacterales bacterium]
MHKLRDWPVRQKITVMIMAIAGVVLLLAFAALFAFQAYTLKQHAAHELGVVGEITAHNCAAAVMFKDEDAASQILGGVRIMPQIVSARLELLNEQRLAFFGAARDENQIKAAHLSSGFQIESDRILLAQPVVINGKPEGTLYLLADLHATTSQLLKLYGGIFALVLVASLLVAFILSSQFLRFVTDPILRLAGTARTIAEQNDYSVRAEKLYADEVGVLTDAFNQMLARIQSQDSALRQAEERYRGIFENAVVGMYQTTIDGRYLAANAAEARILGYGSVEELIAGNFDLNRSCYVDPERRKEFIDLIGKQGVVSRFESAIWRKDGGVVWISEEARALRDAKGKLIGFEGMNIDITERKRAEEESSLMHTTTLAISESKDFEAALAAVLQNVCEATGWMLGQAWVPGADGTVLECVAAWAKDGADVEQFHAMQQDFSFAPGVGLPGRVWTTKQLAWIRDVTLDANFPRSEVARQAGLKAGVAIPVVADNEVVAVVEFFVCESREEDERFAKLISSVVIQLGHLVQRKRLEGSLRASEDRFRSLVQSANDAIVLADERGHIVSWNAGAQRIFGYREEEVVGQPLTMLMPERYRDAHCKGLARFQATGESRVVGKTIELRGVRKDGIEFPLDLSIATWKTEACAFFSAIIRDITERKQAEDALRQSEGKLAQAQRIARLGYWERDLETGRITWSDETYRVFGLASGDNIDMAYFPQLLHPEDRQRVMEEIAQAVAGGPRYDTEYRAVWPNGEVHFVHSQGDVFLDEAGQPRRMFGTVHDITERKQAEEALRQAEQKYRDMFENAIEGMFQTTPEGKFVSVNPALVRIHGFDSPEELMTTVTDIGQMVYVDPERRNEFKRLIEAQGYVELFEYQIYRRDGTKIWICENARGVRDAHGAIFYYEGTIEDITERKRVEEIERASKAKSEFLSRVSHELRTPLNAILGFGQLLERQSETEKQRIRIGYIMSAGRHLLELINEVLDISRIEAGRMQLSLEPVRVTDAIREALELMRPLAAGRNTHIASPCLPGDNTYVMADRQRFKQVLLNLLTNAVKYTPRGGHVSISFEARGQQTVRVAVADNGPGIPEEKVSRLFTPFDRLGAEQSIVQGTGLGLALSQRLMQAMGGAIGLESVVGQGSMFWVELPVAKSPLERIAGRAVERTLGVQLTGERTILYVEDNLSNLTLIEQILADQPQLRLITAMQGRLALDLARQHSPDLILLDLHLPDLPGWTVLAQLKSDEATRHIPVVIISADATAQQVKRLMAAGARAYLTKPIEVTEFFRVVEQTTVNGNGNGEVALSGNGHTEPART